MPWMTASFGLSSRAGRVAWSGAPHMSDVLLDRDAHEGAVLGPGAVVVLHVLLTEQLVQREPGVAGALADAAVGDGRLRGVEAGLLDVELAQLVVAPEGAVVVRGLAPRHVERGGDVAGALALLLREVGRREQLAAELVGAADVDEVLVADGGH